MYVFLEFYASENQMIATDVQYNRKFQQEATTGSEFTQQNPNNHKCRGIRCET
jgi:hypothetical protein